MKHLCLYLLFGLLICHVQGKYVEQDYKCPDEEAAIDNMDKCTRLVSDDPRDIPCVVRCMFNRTGYLLPNGRPDIDRIEGMTMHCSENPEDEKPLIDCFREIEDQVVPKDNDEHCEAFNPILDCVMKVGGYTA